MHSGKAIRGKGKGGKPRVGKEKLLGKTGILGLSPKEKQMT